ncbi:cytochrome C biogenesis protein [Ichthyobacterium seriolicida]|uniref:Cytochrome C biogenesis protein n=2 Tax=Ichthyobacterium seriolicida TaxID=242600 RepID=A0A1J1DWP0_9FLAO|nr:cytochrome C biogenesis protein [Ichthyobacterium seriolicida]
MSDKHEGSLEKDMTHSFNQATLYDFSGVKIVLKEVFDSLSFKWIKGDKEDNAEDVLILDVCLNHESKKVELKGGKGSFNKMKEIEIGGLNVNIRYGAKKIDLPFAIRLDKFNAEKYPGTISSYSSFASEVTVIDQQNDVIIPYRIFMNNVLDYRGYRFFQSSFDSDEKGSVFSVNHDFLGTTVSYIGYMLLLIGMSWTLFSKKSRFSKLKKKIDIISEKKQILLFLLSVPFLNSNAQINEVNNKSIDVDSIKKTIAIDKQHSEKVGYLLVQNKGRIEPINTLASKILRKIHRENHFENYSANQVFISMMSNPMSWQHIPFIYVSNKDLRNKFEAKKYIAFLDAFDEKGTYLLRDEVSKSYKKKPLARTEYDKAIMALDERINILYSLLHKGFLEIFPLPNDSDNKWYSPVGDISMFQKKDSLFITNVFGWYLEELKKAKETGNWKDADKKIEYISKFQRKYGWEIIPSDSKIEAEIFYNKVDIFNRLFKYYLLLGISMLMVCFATIFINRSRVLNYSLFFLGGLTVLCFIAHTLGLILRWYISGNAPWSNGYESMIYVGWATILSGIIFCKKSPITLSSTAILASLILWVASLNWLDPEITNLQPVLKSYWLSIHVSVIVASYGFLALGALLGLLVLIIMIFSSKKNTDRIVLTIKELTYINEMTITIGLFMLTIGTFLGGVWANESWGRYWGWDPKETWAFISIFVYSLILHMRLVPFLKGVFQFNMASILGLGSIIMTYFGVNYYLGGMHSYAKGDPLPIPDFIYYIIVSIIFIGIVSFFRKRRLNI